MNLAMRDVRYPTSEMNVIVEDFFNLRSKMDVLTSYVVKTPKGDIRRKFTIPTFHAVIANPPYTRWIEISEKTQKSIVRSVGELLKKYKLSSGIGRETGIYVHFVIHAYDFLKKNARLGMIISNSWLQSDYGKNFANFLLDHFKIKAIIDFNQRLFRIPLIATCVILLEKEENKESRNANKSAFIYVDKESKVREILHAIKNPEKWKDRFSINIVKQNNLPREAKWVSMIFDTTPIEDTIQNSPYICKVADLFNARHSNVTGIFARGGTGGNVFFYLTHEDVKKRGVDRFVYPLISSSRYSKSFLFNKKDWKRLRDDGKVCFSFIAHTPRNKLPRNVLEYVKYGEKRLRTRVGKTCNKSMSSQMREKSKDFFGWYDLGEILHSPIYVPYYAQYVHRFTLSDTPIVLDADFISFIPIFRMKTLELKALLAYLNSDFNRLYIETHGRTTGGGMLSIEVNQALEMPVLNVRKIRKKHLQELAELFDELEKKTRELGGSDTQENIEELQPFIEDINTKISRIIGFKKAQLGKAKKIVRILSERRISRVMRARPESVKGEEKPRIAPPKKRKRRKEEDLHKPLTRWMG